MKLEDAVAICMACFKQSKKKPENLLSFAIACRTVLKEWGMNETSRYFDVSKYQIRQIDKINELDQKYKKLAEKSNMGIEMLYHIWRLKEPKRAQFANVVQSMKSSDIRTLIHFIRKNPSLSVAECEALLDKTKPEQVSLLVLPLDRTTYERLKKSAEESDMMVHDYVANILRSKKNGKT